MDIVELLFIGLEAFFAGICWTFGGLVAESITDHLFPPDDGDPPAKTRDSPPKKKSKARHFVALPCVAILFSGCASMSCVGCSTQVREGVLLPEYPDTELICRMGVECSSWTPTIVQEALDMWVIAVGDVFDYTPQLPYVIRIEDSWDLGAAGPDIEHTSGKTLNWYTIQVAGRFYYGHGPRTIGTSAFSHELMHVALWTHDKDPDVTHQEPPGPWTEVHDKFLDAFDLDLQKAFPPNADVAVR